MQEKGLGTPATRAAIIEGLIYEKYMLREGRDLIPTAKAFQLMTLLRGLGVEDLTKPELTGNWEFQLSADGAGQDLSREKLHGRDRRAMTAADRGRRPRNTTATPFPGDYATLATPCPNCGGKVKENYRRFSLRRHPRERGQPLRLLDQQDPRRAQLRTARGGAVPAPTRRSGPLEGFRSKAGWPFTAELKLAFDDEIKQLEAGVRFRRGRQEGWPRRARLIDFSGPGVARRHCPKDAKARVFEHGTSYVCQNADRSAHRACDFKSGKIILQQPVAREQMTKLLETGKTELLENFVSNKTRRKFKAFLAFDKKEGKVAFEFEPRAAKVPAKKAAKKVAAE